MIICSPQNLMNVGFTSNRGLKRSEGQRNAKSKKKKHKIVFCGGPHKRSSQVNHENAHKKASDFKPRALNRPGHKIAERKKLSTTAPAKYAATTQKNGHFI